MDRLSMSLDDLISQRDSKDKQKNNKNFNKKFNKNFNKKPIKSSSRGIKKHSFNDNNNNIIRKRFNSYIGEHDDRVNNNNNIRQPFNNNNNIRQPFNNNNNIRQPFKSNNDIKSTSVFSRLGKVDAKVTFSNLLNSVEVNDLRELCSTVGTVEDITFSFNNNSRRVATVSFSTKKEAIACVSKFNGLTLDGLIMTVALADTTPKTVFDRIQQPNSEQSSNVREGMFGTALANVDRGNRGKSNRQSNNTRQKPQPVFSVTLDGGPPAFKQTGGKPFHVRGKGGFRSNNKGNSDDMDLDADLDAYMSGR